MRYLIGALFMDLLLMIPPLFVIRLLPCHCAVQSEFVFKSICNFSQIFFLGFKTSSAVPVSKFSIKTRSPGVESFGGINVSTCFGSSLQKIGFL